MKVQRINKKGWIPKALDEIDPIMPNSSTRMSAVTEEYLDSQLDKLATAYSGKKGGGTSVIEGKDWHSDGLTSFIQKNSKRRAANHTRFIKQLKKKPKNKVVRIYRDKKIPKYKNRTKIYASPVLFAKDISIFDSDLAKRVDKTKIKETLSLIFKKCADRIIVDTWRMPFPNGMGNLYIKEAQISKREIHGSENEITNDIQLINILREVRTGLKRVYLKWAKSNQRFAYKDIWAFRRSSGYFRTRLYEEIIKRAEDPTLKTYKGHII